MTVHACAISLRMSDVTPSPKSVRPTADADDLQKTPVTLGVVLKLLVWGGGIMAAVAVFFLLRDYSRGEQLSEVRASISKVSEQTSTIEKHLDRIDKQLESNAVRDQQTLNRLTAVETKLDTILELLRNKP